MRIRAEGEFAWLFSIKGGGREDGAFEMRRDGPLIKLGAIGIG
jgi:hypothetical protein